MTHAQTKTLKSVAHELRLGDLPLGSLASRVAARALLTSRAKNAVKLDFVVTVVGCPDRYNPPTIGKWSENLGGTMLRLSKIPYGMTIEEAERIAR